MKSAAIYHDRLFKLIILNLVLVFTLVILVNCTVAPKPVKSTEISYDGTNYNSGIWTNAAGQWVLSENKKNEYNALVRRYGSNTNIFILNIKENDGLIESILDGKTNYIIDDEHLVKFLKMKSSFRNGQ